jgi:hypothetical protein
MRTRLPLTLALAMLLGGLATPSRSASQAALPADFYGTWYDGLSRDSAGNAPAYGAQASAGVRVIRQYVFWDRIEVRPGEFDWRRMDEMVRDTADRGLTILPTLLYTPAFYSSKPPTGGATASTQYPPRDPATMAAFARAMVERYGPRGTFWCPPWVPAPVPRTMARQVEDALPCDDSAALRAWEVWNEPDLKAWWKGRPDPQEYARLLTAVSAAIKAADPGAEVVLGSLTGAGATDGFLDRLYDLGAGDAFDTIAFNPYARNVKDMVGRIRAARAVAARRGDPAKPIRVLEYGWATGGRSDLTTVSAACQAALLYAATVRLGQVREELGIRGVVQFQWQDSPARSTAWPDYAGVVRVDGTGKPSLAAFAAAIAGDPAPAGAGPTACPADRRAVR